MQNIVIDEEFRALIPPMAAESLAQLEANIRAEGLRDNFVIWFDGRNRVLIDGHHRWEILNKLGQTPYDRFTGMEFPDRESVKLWILQNQVGRRNLTLEQRTMMVAKIVILRQQQSAAVSKANLKQGDKTPDTPKTGASGGETVRKAAKEFSVPRAPLQAAVTAIKDNEPNPKACDICSASFESKGAMKEHGKKAHAEVLEQHKQEAIAQRAAGSAATASRVDSFDLALQPSSGIPDTNCEHPPQSPNRPRTKVNSEGESYRPEKRKNRSEPVKDFEVLRALALRMVYLGYQQLKIEAKKDASHLAAAKDWAQSRLNNFAEVV